MEVAWSAGASRQCARTPPTSSLRSTTSGTRLFDLGGRRDACGRLVGPDPAAERLLELSCDGKHVHLAVAAPDHLDTDRQALGRAADRDSCRGEREDVRVRRKTEDVDFLELPALERQDLCPD